MPLLEFDLEERHGAVDAGGVDQDVNGTETLLNLEGPSFQRGAI